LVVSTPIEIILLGLAFSKDQQMTIYRTEMTVSSDNVNMTLISGTDSGRIFMRGSNGQLYELVYQAHDGWLTRKMRKVNHSTSGLSILVPEFLKWSSGGFGF
jgi:nuclear pore complex protein Nup155